MRTTVWALSAVLALSACNKSATHQASAAPWTDEQKTALATLRTAAQYLRDKSAGTTRTCNENTRAIETIGCGDIDSATSVLASVGDPAVQEEVRGAGLQCHSLGDFWLDVCITQGENTYQHGWDGRDPSPVVNGCVIAERLLSWPENRFSTPEAKAGLTKRFARSCKLGLYVALANAYLAKGKLGCLQADAILFEPTMALSKDHGDEPTVKATRDKFLAQCGGSMFNR